MKKIFLIPMFAAMIGCSSPTPSVQTQTVMMPLSIGNTWTYRVTSDSMGTTQVQNVFDSVVGTKLLSGEEWTEVKRYFPNSIGLFSRYFQNRSDGVYQYLDSTLTFHIVKYPAQQGDTCFYWPGSPHGSFPLTLESQSHVITIPAGTFPSYYYTLSNQDSNGDGSSHLLRFTLQTATEIEYYPGIGMLRSDDTALHETFELVNYQVH